jgi:hypothetical protein
MDSNSRTTRRTFLSVAAAVGVAATATPTLAQAGKAAPSADRGVRRHALLIGCTKYDNLDQKNHLKGPANDVVLFRRLLEDRYKVDSKSIITLAEGQGGPTSRPTRENIEREFKALADRDKVHPGDQVIILMGGHGFFVPNNNPSEEDPEPDGYDEVFLPADCGLWNSASRTIPNCIRDDDLSEWLAAIRSAGAFVWLIADSCHSGTLSRDPTVVQNEVKRELNKGDLGIVTKDNLGNETDDPAFKPVGQQRGSEGGSEIADGSPLRGNGRLVAIYAARSIEPTVELPLPYETDPANRKPYGLLTFTICQILTRASTSLSYSDLIERIGQQYHAWGRQNPTPQAEGDGMKEPVLAISRGGELPGWASSGTRGGGGYFLKEGSGNTFNLDAGTLHGLSPNCILAVQPQAGQGDQILGYVTVQECTALDSVLKPCEYKGAPAVEKTKLPIGGRVKVVWVDFAGLKPLRVALDATGQPPAANGPIDLAALVKAAPPGMLEKESEPSAADWVIRIKDSLASLLPVEDWAKARTLAASAVTPKSTSAIVQVPPDDAGQKKLATALRRIAHARNLLSVTEPADSSRLGPSGVDIKLEFRRYKNKNDLEGIPIGSTTGESTPFIEPGELVGVNVTNQGADDIYVTLLFIDANYRITKWYPTRGNLPDQLAPKKRLGPPAIPRATVTDETYGLEHFVAIAVRAEGQPQDFGWLAEETPEQALAMTRGTQTPLNRLFQYAAFRKGSERGAAPEEGAANCIRTIAWNVAPPQAAPKGK